jgi:hypothetical protein
LTLASNYGLLGEKNGFSAPCQGFFGMLREISIRNANGESIEVVRAEIIGDIFGIHYQPYVKNRGWIVTHIRTGFNVIGPAGPFNRKFAAVHYAQALLDFPINWQFDNKSEMETFNDLNLLQAFAIAARKEANKHDNTV